MQFRRTLRYTSSTRTPTGSSCLQKLFMDENQKFQPINSFLQSNTMFLCHTPSPALFPLHHGIFLTFCLPSRRIPTTKLSPNKYTSPRRRLQRRLFWCGFCADCQPCGNGTYRSEPCTEVYDAVCATCAETCAGGDHFVLSPCTAETDLDCHREYLPSIT